MRIGRIQEIRRYPVKSMGGELLSSVALGAGGLPGDRAWAVRDEERGGIRGAKRFAGLMTCSARYPEPPGESGSSPALITLPDGTECATGDEGIAERLSGVIGSPVTLWPLLPADALDHYKRGAPGNPDMEKELRAIFGRTPDEPLPNLGSFPPEILQYESPPGTYFDAFPLLVMTDASLRRMSESAPDSAFDVRRFRPNFVVEVDDAGAEFPERGWTGRRVRLGQAVIDVTIDCPRCVMTTHGFEDLPKDPNVMRSLVKHAEGNLGVYAKIAEPGDVRVGDPVELAD